MTPSPRNGRTGSPRSRRAARGALPALVAFACSLASAASAFAHPIHSSLAEADYNGGTQKLEVALRVFADDFEAALSARAKKKISLEKTPAAEFDPLARAYLAECFTVTSADRVVARHEWIGRAHQDAANELWLFFEVVVPGGIEGATLHHAVLHDLFSDQINTVQVRDGDRRTTLVFLASHRAKPVRFRPQGNS